MKMNDVIIIGAGAAGLSAALELAEKNISCILISDMPSERAQSVMAQGGINGALDNMGEGDSPRLHAEETLEAGRFLADSESVMGLCRAAPQILRELLDLGMSLNLDENGNIAQRPFGGQSKKRTAFASSDTGKQLMHTLIAQVRKYEAAGLVKRMSDRHFFKLIQENGAVKGCIVYQRDKDILEFIPAGHVIIASGGCGGLFGNYTGSMQNAGAVSASLFAQGVTFANMEFIQFHPTTTPLYKKNMLISEAARGEGGRLFCLREGKPCYFMEEKYPVKGNLMPRDVVSREEWSLIKNGEKIWLDIRGMDKEVYERKLSSVVEDCRHFLNIDPVKEPIPVEPGVHYFMGGIQVDRMHRASLKGLYGAGECACIYHGANRLGGNSLLGAIYGGRVAADTIANEIDSKPAPEKETYILPEERLKIKYYIPANAKPVHSASLVRQMNKIMTECMGIERNEPDLLRGLESLTEILKNEVAAGWDASITADVNLCIKDLYLLAIGSIKSALNRKESRGAHFRSDFPAEREEYRKTSLIKYDGREIHGELTPLEAEL